MAGAIAKINGKLVEQKVITVLQGGPATFEGLMEMTKLQKSSLSTVLRDLEGKDCIERKAVPRKTKVGRQRHYEILIELTSELLTPEVRALWNLTHISPLAPLDLKKGTELLTDDIVNTFLKQRRGDERGAADFRITAQILAAFFPADQYELSSSKTRDSNGLCEVSLKMSPSIPKTGLEFNEYCLLQGLAEFNAELMLAIFIKTKGTKPPAEMVKFYKHGLKTFERFPLLSEARKNGTMKQFEGLLDWIRPLIEPPIYTKTKEISPSADVFDKSIVVVTNWNLAAAVFKAAATAYANMLSKIPSLYKKMRSSKKSKKRKGPKGGEK